MQIDLQHVSKFKTAFRSRASLRFCLGRMSNFLLDLIRFGKGANMANGNALVGRLLRSALNARVSLWRHSPAVSDRRGPRQCP
jgi:hypothetical protein